MSLTERLKHRGRKFSNAVLGPRDPDSLNLEHLFFDPNIKLPTTCASTTNSSACSSCEAALSRPRLLPGNKTEHQAAVDQQGGFPPPIPTRDSSRLRHRRRGTSPGRRPPKCLGCSLARSATDPSTIDFEHSFLPPIPKTDPSHRQLERFKHPPASTAQPHSQNSGLVLSSLASESEQILCSSRRGPTFQSHRRLQTSPARLSQDFFHDIGGLGRRSASVSKYFHSDRFDQTLYNCPARLPQHRISPVDTQDPSQHYPRLLASSIFDTSADSSLVSLRLEQPTQAIRDQSTNSLVPTGMAAMRASTFLDPNSARSSRLPESQIFTRNEAKKQEAVIHAKLKSAGEPIPPYEFLNFIGKGSYGRVYLA